MNLDYRLIRASNDLFTYKREILNLFHECFGKELYGDLWDWAFLRNPCGEAIVSLCFNENNKLIGHYAAIPVALMNSKGKLKALLSMTTMVSPGYRKYGLFVEQANRVYKEAGDCNQGLIFGFPNANSAPGFRKRLGWIISASDYVARVSKADLESNIIYRNMVDDPDLLDIDFDDKVYRKWRLSKPGTEYIDRGEVVLKKYGCDYDLVYAKKDFLNKLQDNEGYTVLIDGRTNCFREKSVFNYQFGYRSFVGNQEYKFKKFMLLSDIF